MGNKKWVPPPSVAISNKKGPKTLEAVSGQKTPVIAESVTLYEDRKIAWRVSKIQLVDPYGWHSLDAAGVYQMKQKLGYLERSTWKDVFVRDARNNHSIRSDQLKCSIARKWMAENMPDQPLLWTIRISARERIWGIISEAAYQIIFWDPDHLIWPVPKN
jgi:hypothetical protein